MGVINVLSFEVANLIAAGEVVDRPGSVIKELVENSIDAGATRVTVEIQRGGVLFMRVTDNGKGMSPDDLPVAIRRHATSKIKDAKDLEAIITLGFRGEALAAICSVADVRIISKQKDSLMGAQIAVHSGRPEAVTETGAADGTTVIVENLFANVPARLKFLKRDITEAAYVAALVEKIAMSHPEIAINFISDGNMKLSTSGDGSLQGVIRAVYGRDFAAKTLVAESELGGIRVSGYITAPDVPRANRNYQNFFINGRYVKSKTAAAALEQAYRSYIPPEKFPGCILKLEISPSAVDVNVHPSKLEVKFSDERPVFDAVYRAVRDALLTNTLRPGGENGELKPQVKNVTGAFVPVRDRADSDGHKDNVQLGIKDAPVAAPVANGEREKFRTPVTGLGGFGGQFGPAASGYTVPRPKDAQIPTLDVKTPQAASQEANEAPKCAPAAQYASKSGEAAAFSGQEEKIKAPEQPMPGRNSPAVKPYRIIGELFNSYILVEEGDSVTVIDKHAAHERLNFERMKQTLKGSGHPATYLAVPLELSLSSEELSVIDENSEKIRKLGFEFTKMQSGLKITGIPMEIRMEDAVPMLETIADVLVNGTGDVDLIGETAFEKALYQASCKASIKAGRVYPEGYAERLVEELYLNPEITYCPHGRPVAFKLTKNEVNHKFKRN